MKITFFLFFAAAFIAVFCKEEVDISHGFGNEIDWVSWDNALDLAKEQNKPIFLLIHKTWCGACKALKKNFKASNKKAELIETSKKFIMVNLEDDEEPEDERYAPDGAYIPRLFFLDKNGDPMAVDNKKNYPNNAYYFPQAVDVLKAMKVALNEFGGSNSDESKKEEKENTVEKKDNEKEKEEVVPEKKAKKEEKSKTEEKKTEKKAEKKSEKKEEKTEKKDKKKDDKKETKEKDSKKEEKEKNDKKDKKDKKDEKTEKKDKKEKSEKKDSKKDGKKETKEKDSKKEEKKEKKEKKSDDGKKSKKEGEKKKKTEL